MAKPYPNYKQQLKPFGLNNSLSIAGIVPSDDGESIIYPCFYPPDGDEYHLTHRARTLYATLDAKPGFRRHTNPSGDKLYGGMMPPFYIYDWHKLLTAIRDNNGTLYMVEGDKDVWTLIEAGRHNVAGFFGATDRIDQRVVETLKKLGVNLIEFYPDADAAGHGLAKNLLRASKTFNLTVKIHAFPYEFDGQEIKDTNDLYCAFGFQNKSFLSYYDKLPILELIDEEKAKALDSERHSFFEESLYEEIENRLGLHDFNPRTGWSVKYHKCLFSEHSSDDVNPKMQWNHNLGVAECFKCAGHNGKITYLTKDVANALGINWRDYIKKNATIEKPIGAADIVAAMNDKKNFGVSKFDPLAPVESYSFSMREQIKRVNNRIIGVESAKFHALPNPILPFRSYSPIIKRPSLVGVYGMSGGFKTSMLTTIMNQLLAWGYNGMIWSPEWNAEEHAVRFVQQAGGLALPQMLLLERYNYEAQSENVDFRFGVKPDDDRLRKAANASKNILDLMKGELFGIEGYGVTITELELKIIEVHKKMTLDGIAPSFLIFDYVQLAEPPHGEKNWQPENTLRALKALSDKLGIVTFVSTQVRKSDTERMKGNNSNTTMTSTSGLIRDDSLQLAFGLVPRPYDLETGQELTIYTDKGTFMPLEGYITKNSIGSTAEKIPVPLYVFLERMIIVGQDMKTPLLTLDSDDPDWDSISQLLSVK